MDNPTNDQTAPPCLPMMLVDLIKEFYLSASQHKERGNDEAYCCTSAAGDRLAEVLGEWHEELKAWQIHRAAAHNSKVMIIDGSRHPLDGGPR